MATEATPTVLARTDAMSKEDHAYAEREAVLFRQKVEAAYRAGRIRRRRVERLGTIGRGTRKYYFKELKDLVATCLRNGIKSEDVLAFRRFVRRWIKRGAPIDPKASWIPGPSLQIVLRQVATALPSLGIFHGDAKLWLSDPLIRSRGRPIPAHFKSERNYIEHFVPFNLCLYAPEGTHYASFNRHGFSKEWVDLETGDAA